MRKLSIDKVIVKDFFSWEDGEVEFPTYGLFHLGGENGAGKSSLVMEACVWLFYEKTVRSIPAGGVVRAKPTPQKSCEVTVHLKWKGKKYVLTRYRGHKDYGRALHVNGSPKTMSWFKDTTGLDFHVFQNSCFFSADDYNFPLLGPQVQAQVVEKLFNLSQYEVAKKMSDAKVKAARYAQEEAEIAVRRLRTQIEQVKEDLRDAQQESTDFQCHSASVHQGLVEAATTEYRGYQAEMLAYHAHRNALAMLKFEVNKVNKALDKAIVGADKKSQECQALVYGEQAGMHVVVVALRKARELEIGVCDKCGSRVTAKHRHSSIRSLRAACTKLKARVNQAKALHTKALSRLGALVKRTVEIPDVTVAQHKLEFYQGQTEKSYEKLQRLETVIPVSNPYAQTLVKLEKRLKDTEIKLTDARSTAKKKVTSVNYHLAASRNFQKMRLWKLRGITDELNISLEKAMAVLTGGSMNVYMRTVQQLKSGELREKYGVEIVNDRGGDTFKSLSKGEQGRVKVAFMLAFSEVASSLSDVQINLTVLDEVLSGLDKSGVESMLDALRIFAQNRCITLLSADERVSAYPVASRGIVHKDQQGISRL